MNRASFGWVDWRYLAKSREGSLRPVRIPEVPFESEAWDEYCDDVQLRRQEDGEAVER